MVGETPVKICAKDLDMFSNDLKEQTRRSIFTPPNGVIIPPLKSGDNISI